MTRGSLTILQLTHQGGPAGSTQSIFDLGQHLARRGHRVLVGCRADVLLARLARDAGLPVVPLSFLPRGVLARSEEHTSELQSQSNLVCRLLLEKKKNSRLPHRTPRAEGRLTFSIHAQIAPLWPSMGVLIDSQPFRTGLDYGYSLSSTTSHLHLCASYDPTAHLLGARPGAVYGRLAGQFAPFSQAILYMDARHADRKVYFLICACSTHR